MLRTTCLVTQYHIQLRVFFLYIVTYNIQGLKSENYGYNHKYIVGEASGHR